MKNKVMVEKGLVTALKNAIKNVEQLYVWKNIETREIWYLRTMIIQNNEKHKMIISSENWPSYMEVTKSNILEVSEW